jgi:hypothetical protein
MIKPDMGFFYKERDSWVIGNIDKEIDSTVIGKIMSIIQSH